MERAAFGAILAACVVCFHGCRGSIETSDTVNTSHRSESAETVVSNEAASPFPGYTLFAPLRSSDAYLVNMDKRVVHSWKAQAPPGSAIYLLDNGDLLRGARDPDHRFFRGGGIGAKVQRLDWNSNVVWEFEYANQQHCLHHDIQPLPNGNILMIAWENKTEEEAIAAGRDPALIAEGKLWPLTVIEVDPSARADGEIVWQWHLWDHLVQDFDKTKDNYGLPNEHPELIDLNYVGQTPPVSQEELRRLRSLGYVGGEEAEPDPEQRRRMGRPDWIHTNAIHYNTQLDQIALSALRFNEIWIIDHSTTTEEAAGHSGGRQGKGGDILYRWGNPAAYRSGTAVDQRLFAQHDVRWIPPGHPGEGNIMVFNNGRGRPEGDYSSVDEIVPPVDEQGSYTLSGAGTFGPDAPVWSYTSEPESDFFAGHISGAHRLPNGNTLVCNGEQGRIIEVNSSGETLWEYAQPYGGELNRDGRPGGGRAANGPPRDRRGPPRDAPPEPGRPGSRIDDGAARSDDQPNDRPRRVPRGRRGRRRGPNQEVTAVFRAARLALDHSGLAGKRLEPLDPQPVPFRDRQADERQETASLESASDSLSDNSR